MNDFARQDDRSTGTHDCSCGCGHGMTRRGFLGNVGGATLLGGATLMLASPALAYVQVPITTDRLPVGKSLRVQPVLTYDCPQRQDRTSWRGYGGVQTPEAAQEEAARIQADWQRLAPALDFPIEVLPLSMVANKDQLTQALAVDCDVRLVYAAGGNLVYDMAAAANPIIVFVRHRTEPHYLWYEIAHWRLLRGNGDEFVQPGMSVDDVVVDDEREIAWRLRALYGLKNARGTKMLAIGGLVAYSEPGQEFGPPHAREIWNYEFEELPYQAFAQRLQQTRADETALREVEQQTSELVAQPNLTLRTDRKFVFNTLLALRVIKQILQETGATNFGFGHCMGRDVIEMLDTPPCLLLSLANDEGLTAYCHTDLTHTLPGVLMRWIANRPSFVCNSHFPHDGLFTVAHCAAPRKMNGKDLEPTTIMTHFESDYGAATKVEYTKGQTLTVVIPNLRCTKWQGFRGTVLDSPSRPACRSQIDIQIDGDWRGLQAAMEGFHVQVCYGDYLREIGYALRKLGQVEWQNFSPAVA
jgi:L-fucose isomerase-like protein